MILLLGVISTKALIFDCNFHSDRDWWVVGCVYTCYTTVTLNQNIVKLEDVTGNHKIGKGNSDVEALHIENQKLISIPEAISKFFPNLSFIRIADSQLISISAEDFRSFPALRVFDVPGNVLTELDRDLFKFTPIIEYIYFGWNLIEHVEQGIFDQLGQLNFLSFINNPCINAGGNNRQLVLGLKEMLLSSCPPLASTTIMTTTVSTSTDFCELVCVSELQKQIDDQQTEIRMQNEKISKQNKKISEVLTKISDQDQQILNQSQNLPVLLDLIKQNKERIAEVEKAMWEIIFRPFDQELKAEV